MPHHGNKQVPLLETGATFENLCQAFNRTIDFSLEGDFGVRCDHPLRRNPNLIVTRLHLQDLSSQDLFFGRRGIRILALLHQRPKDTYGQK